MVAFRRMLSYAAITALLAAAALAPAGPPAEAARMPAPPGLGAPTLTDPNGDPGAMPSPFDDPVAVQRGLSRKLDRASRTRSENARRGLLDGPAPARQAFDHAGCRVDPSPACLLDEAVATALRIERPELRDWVLGELLAVQASAGLGEKTWQTARHIDDPGIVMVALANIAKSHANAGRFAAAGRAADILPDALLRQDVYLHIAEAQLGLGQTEAARATVVRAQNEAARIYDTRDRVRLHARMASVLERAGEPAGAHRALAVASHEAESLSDGAARESAFRHLALAHTDAGRIDRALDLLTEIRTDDERTPVLVRTATAQAGRDRPPDPGPGHRRTHRPARYRAQVLGRIARIQAQSGRADDARVIELPYARAFALHSIVGDLTDADAAIDLARRASAEIGNERLHVRALWAIADAMGRGGNDAGASRARAEADGAMMKLRSPVDRAWLFGELSLRLAVAGDAAADGVATPSARARVLGHLAQALLGLGTDAGD